MSSEVPYQFFALAKEGPQQMMIIWYKPLLLQTALLSYKDQEIRITIEPRLIDATVEEHAYYRASIRWLIDNTEAYAGWDEQVLNHEFKKMFIGHPVSKEIHYPNGEIKIVDSVMVPSTAEIGKKKMAFLISEMIRYNAEHGILIPAASDFVLKKYSKKIRDVRHEPNQEQRPDPSEHSEENGPAGSETE